MNMRYSEEYETWQQSCAAYEKEKEKEKLNHDRIHA